MLSQHSLTVGLKKFSTTCRDVNVLFLKEGPSMFISVV